MCINTGQEVLKKSESDSSVVPNEWTRGNEHKLKHKKLKKKKSGGFLSWFGLVWFVLSVVKHWKLLPEDCGIFILGAGLDSPALCRVLGLTRQSLGMSLPT